MLEKLKPCPFCGGEARIYKDPRYAAIVCKECGARVRQPISIELCAVDTVIKKWNRKLKGTCKDCIHRELCADYVSSLAKIQNADVKYISQWLDEIEGKKNQTDNKCEHLADRSRFVELTHAEWVEDEDMYGDPIYRCSNCNEHFVLEEGTPTDNCYSYCPNCGAKMDEQALKEREKDE